MDVDGQKDLYEKLDVIAGNMGEGADILADVLLKLVGRDNPDGYLDPPTRDKSNHVAARWLRDHGHLPKRSRVW